MRTIVIVGTLAVAVLGLTGPAAALPPPGDPQDPCVGKHPPRACTAGNPTGTLTDLRREPSGILVAGTATDPDSPGPVQILVTVDGTTTGSLSASGAGGAFSGTVPPRAGNKVCVIAVNQQEGDDTSLGCRTLAVRVNPFGHLDEVRAVTGGVRVKGWAIDPDTVNPVQVRLRVDGVERTVQAAWRDRPDIATAYPGYGAAHGFDVVIMGNGRHTSVCAEALSVGPGTEAALGCGRDGNAVSVLNLNLRGVHDEWNHDSGTGTVVIPWRERYDRVAAWMQRTGTVPDVITLQEVWIRKFWAFPLPHLDPADYETLFVLIALIRARTGVNYRIAYADAPYTPNGVNSLYSGGAMLYNADRLRNTTTLVNAVAVAGSDTSTLGVHMRTGFPCANPLGEQAPMCALIDLDGRHWVSSYLDAGGTWMRGPMAATFELAADPGKHILVHNVHAVPSVEADAALRGLVDGVWARWLPRTKLLPPIVAGDFNGGGPPADFDTSVAEDVDLIALGKPASYPSVLAPSAATEFFPARLPNRPHCGMIATLVSDHCALFTQYLPAG